MKPLRLSDVCLKIGSGATPRGGKEVYLEAGEVTLIRSQNIYNDRFERNGLAFITQEHADQLKSVEIREGDVLLNITGDSVARVCQVPTDVIPARVNQHVAIIRPNTCRLDPKFLHFYLASPQMQAELLSLAAAGATRKALTKRMIESFEVPMVSIDVQRDIAGLLGALEDKIDLNRRMSETLEAMARAIFKDWFVDFGPTRAKAEGRAPYLAPDLWGLFPETMGVNLLPNGWHRLELGEVLTTLETGKRPRGGVAAYTDGVPSLGAESVTRVGEFDFSKTKYVPREFFESMKKGHISQGDVLIYKDGGKPGELRPAVSYVSCGFPFSQFCINEHVFRARTSSFSQPYFYCLLSTEDAFSQMQELATGVAQPGLNRTAINSVKFTMPSDSRVLDAASSQIDPLIEGCNKFSLNSLALAQTLDFLLPKLMSGEIRLGDAEKVVEAVA